MGDDWSSQTSTWCGYIDGPGACLFNIREDPHETVNLASSLPQKVEELKSRVRTLRESLFNPDRCLPYKPPLCGKPDAVKALEARGGYLGPYIPTSEREDHLSFV